MLRAADADRPVIQPGMGFGVTDQLGQRAHRELGACGYHNWEDGDRRDRREILLRIVTEIAIERLVGGGRPGAGCDQGVAVRSCARAGERPDISSGAWPVVDNERLPDRLCRVV